MAHFAKLGIGNIVEKVEVVSNDIATTEQAGVDFLNKLYNTRDVWKQTSYNNNFRKRYAGIGTIYDAAKNKFLGSQPYASWSLDASDDWQAPVAAPTITTYGDPEKRYHISWDEAGQKWTAQDSEEPQNSFNWDASGLTWVSA